MKRSDVAVAMAAALCFGFVAVLMWRTPSALVAPAPPEASTQTATGGDAQDAVIGEASALPAPVRDIAAIRTVLARDAAGTYIGDILALRDSNVARWPARTTDPVRVWIDERSNTPGFTSALASDVRRAFADWGRAGAPLTFTFTGDSASADVTVTFRERFDEPISGRTRWVRDPHWWIVGGDIVLALRTPTDRVVTAPQLYAIALHEIGHLLGLDHTTDTSAVMAPRVSALQLAASDVATMRLIYMIPPGSVRAVPPETP